MPSPYFSPEHDRFRDSVRRFVTEELTPNVERWEEQGALPAETWHLLGTQQMLGISTPREAGGSGADLFFSVIMLEEIAACAAGGVVAAVAMHTLVAIDALARFGSDVQKTRWLKNALRGETRIAVAESSSQPGNSVKLSRSGDQLRLSGRLTNVLNGQTADLLLAVARDGAGNPHPLLLDLSHVEGERTPAASAGWRSAALADFAFDKCTVDPKCRLKGYDPGRFLLARALGTAATATVLLDLTRDDLVLRRRENGTDADGETLRLQFAGLAAEMAAARHLLYHAVWSAGTDGDPVPAAMAAHSAAGTAGRIADACLRYQGRLGSLSGAPIERLYRDLSMAGRTADNADLTESLARHFVDADTASGTATGSEDSDRSDVDLAALVESTAASGNGDPAPDRDPVAPRRENAASGSLRPAAPSRPSGPVRIVDEEEHSPDAADTAIPSAEAATPPADAEPASGDAPQDMPLPDRSVDAVMTHLPRRFRPDRAVDYRGRFHFRISGSEGGDFTVLVDNGECRVTRGIEGEAICAVETNAKTYLDIESGKANPQVAFMMGKIRISNVPEMTRFTRMFHRLPDT